MKKVVLVALSALAVAATVALADDDNAAKSVNAVGVVKYTIPAEAGLTCIALPLNPLDTTSTNGYWVWGETSLASQLDKGSMVYFWTGSKWAGFTKNRLTGVWAGAVDREIKPGEAFFVKSASSNKTDKVISLLGELPTEDSLSYDVTGSSNLDTRSVTMYPVEVVFGETELAEALPKGSMVYFWTGSKWAGFTKNRLTGVWAGATNRPVAVGEGVFVKSTGSAGTIEMERPFDWED